MPVLLVHGFPLDHTMWQFQLGGLVDLGRIIAPDLRGFGRSVPCDRPILTMETLADDLAAILEALQVEEPIVFCGLSMGGYVAWEFWRRHGQRLRGLILCDTRAAPDSPEAAAQRLENAAKVMDQGVKFFAEMMVARLFCPQTAEKQPDLVAAIRQVMENTLPQSVAATLRGLAQRVDARPWLSQINVPTLVLVGEHDVVSPPDEMDSMAQAIPGSKFVKIPEAGHLAPLENPTAVNLAIREFLSNL